MPERRLQSGELLAARYRIEAVIGRGGMAVLYRASDERLGRRVALKLLAEPYVDQPESAERFLAEARTAASLSHPNLVHVYDSGVDAGAHFIVMELLERYRSLRELLADEGPLPADRAVGLAVELLDGLAAVHRRGLVHRDVKSANVMVGPGPAKLIDFGIAEATSRRARESAAIGSLPYMAPEQLRGEAATPRSDLFALGVVLYEATTARLPFGGSTPDEVLRAQRAGPAPPRRLATMPARLDRAIVQVLSPDPERRFVDAGAMSTALRSISDPGDAAAAPARGAGPAADDGYVPPLVRRSAPPPARPGRAPRDPGRQRGWLPILLGVGVGLLLTAVVAGLVLRLDPGLPAGSPSPAGPTPTGTLAPGMVRVPNAIGLSEAEAEALASESGLRWTIRWREVPDASPGIYDQEPPAGSVVERGSRFTMYAYRVPD